MGIYSVECGFDWVIEAILLRRCEDVIATVKSGGHASFKGASNIDSAVAIDLPSLTSFAISSIRK